MPPPIEIVTALPTGVIAVILEALALSTGLLIAGNLQAIVSLSARRRVYVRGYAKLQDAMWDVGLIEGIACPKLMFRDWRSALAFFLAAVVVVLEALTVLSIQPGESCDFSKPTSWSIEKKSLSCHSSETYFEKGGAYDPVLQHNYIPEARTVLQDADAHTGAPNSTDVFEKTILNMAAVEALQPHETIFNARLTNSSTLRTVATVNSESMKSWVNGINENVTSCLEILTFRPLGLRSVNRSSAEVETTGFISVGSCDDGILHEDHERDFPSIQRNCPDGTNFPLQQDRCSYVLTVRVCRYGRKLRFGPDFQEVRANCDVFEKKFAPGPLAGDDNEYYMELDSGVALVLSGDYKKGIERSDVERAILIVRVAANSLTQRPCLRYIAVPKICTQVGWVSTICVILLGALFFVTLFIRLTLLYLVRSALDWSSDKKRLVNSVIDHFDPEEEPHHVQKRGTRKLMRSEEQGQISVLRGSDPGSSRVEWARHPAIPPVPTSAAGMVSGSSSADTNAESFS